VQVNHLFGVYDQNSALATARLGELELELGDGPRRSAFAISADGHGVFHDDAVLWSFAVGLGGEWY